MKRNNKKYWFYILWMNCNCASHNEARTTLPSGNWNSARCKFCGKMLGIFEWKILDRVKALGEFNALQIYEEKLCQQRSKQLKNK